MNNKYVQKHSVQVIADIHWHSRHPYQGRGRLTAVERAVSGKRSMPHAPSGMEQIMNVEECGGQEASETISRFLLKRPHSLLNLKNSDLVETYFVL